MSFYKFPTHLGCLLQNRLIVVPPFRGGLQRKSVNLGDLKLNQVHFDKVKRIKRQPLNNFASKLALACVANNSQGFASIIQQNNFHGQSPCLEYSLDNYHRSNQDTCLVHKPAVVEGQWVQSGDLLADCSASVGGELSLGQNILIAYMPWEGYNFEDAILISERLVYDDLYTSIHIERYETELKDTKLGPEQITRDIPEVSQDSLKHLHTSGIAKLGTWIQEGDILVGKVTPISKKNQSNYQKLLYTILEKPVLPVRDSSLRAPKGINAKVIGIQIFKKNKNDSSDLSAPTLKGTQLLRRPQARRGAETVDLHFPARSAEGNEMQPKELLATTASSARSAALKGCGAVALAEQKEVQGRSASKHQPTQDWLQGLHQTESNVSFFDSVDFLRIYNRLNQPFLEIKNRHKIKSFSYSSQTLTNFSSKFAPKKHLERFTVPFHKGSFFGEKDGGWLKKDQAISLIPLEGQKLIKKQKKDSTAKETIRARLQKKYFAFSLWATRDKGQTHPIQRLNLLKYPKKNQKASNPNTTNLKNESHAKKTEKKINLNRVASIQVYLAEKRRVQVGDKMAGRHGNKGIISQILPREDMPYLPDGTPLDMVLNPLGVPSRMNVGQIYECLLGLAGKHLGENYKVFPFDEIYGAEASRSFVYSKLYNARVKTGKNWLFNPNSPGKIRLYDGRTGDGFNQPVTVGYAYMLRLVHMVDDKIHARSTGPYSLVTQQPLRGRSKQGGQRLGEMEVWALEGYGAAFTLLEMLTIKSDDMTGRMTLWSNLILNKEISIGTPESFKVLICELQALCLDIGLFRVNSSPSFKTRTS